MLNKEEINAEWIRVKDTKNLYRYYKDPTQYQKWRNRFIAAGYIITKKNISAEQRRALNRQYYRQCRKTNKDKIKVYVRKYWINKLQEEKEQVLFE